eukprot:2616696-Heterocapsa_arctica.AAC.1
MKQSHSASPMPMEGADSPLRVEAEGVMTTVQDKVDHRVAPGTEAAEEAVEDSGQETRSA